MNYQVISVLVLIALLPYKIIANSHIKYEKTNYYLDDIQKFKKIIHVCPEESSRQYVAPLVNKNGEEFSACEYQYFCHKNEPCVKIHTVNNINYFDYITYGEYLTNINDKSENMIFISCSEKSFKNGMCNTDICEKDSDCFSNNCVKGVCMVNDSNPSYICRTTKENSELKVKCLLAYEEKCNNDNECGDIASCSKDKICVIHNEKDENGNDFMKYIISLIAIIYVIIILIAIYYVRKNNHNEKESIKTI
ncbi:hypothetical protein BCR36DRAFT_400282 [Piromyces finnis]|uniref:Dickkopf N-terminal cysteine-rich domain-containing protein n=1 Tax=Piromyces finnis TaxID=1754191 RepID=A0A1Y1UWN4_9FUNG|nr:hypothetical protein BCR36DRAFT_400282 [Piromyces finnis]|eukprot:ORX42569.1 hypothetical protein BCR36DRAFT_400282 [Piromyces finnis]